MGEAGVEERSDERVAEAPPPSVPEPVPEPEPVPVPAPDPTEPTSDAPPPAPLAPRAPTARAGALALAFALGAASMGVVTILLVRAERRNTKAAVAAALLAIPPAPVATAAADAGSLPASSEPAVEAAPVPPPLWRLASLNDDPTVHVTQGEIGKHTMLSALGSAGLVRADAFRLIKAFEGIKSFDHCAPKDTYAVAKDKESGKVVAFEYATSPIEVWQARDHDGVLEAKRLDFPVEQKRVAVGLAVGDDLRASIVSAGLDDDLTGLLDDALEGHAELADLQKGARLRIVATEERVEGSFVRYGELDAVEYTPANPSAPRLRVYWYAKAPPVGAHAHPGGFYDGKGQQPYHGGWRTPVPLARIASRFNPRRMHPVLHVIMPHNGVDFAAPAGTPIYASASGVVKTAGDGGPCGNMVQIQHTGGLVSSYCHMSRFAAGIHVGQHVDQRQLVGYVGQTGRATGPHLHFAIKRGDVFLDPLAFKLDGVRVLPPGMRDDFAKTRVDMDLALEAIPMPAPVAGSAAVGDGGAGAAEETVYDDSPGLE